MVNACARIKCPRCRHEVSFDMGRSNYIQQREAEFRARENNLRERERILAVRETEHTTDVRLIKSCLHPDKHPDQTDLYTKAWQAFERLLASAAKPEPVGEYDDNIPF